MDVFQLVGDFLHLVAILLLLLKIIASKNVVGLSYKTQELFTVVFLTRYSDMILENHWGSLYFNIMRFLFISISAVTIYYMRFKRPYKLVNLFICRAMIQKQMAFHITIFTCLLLYLHLFCIKSSLFMEFSKLFLGGLRLFRSCPSSI